MISLCSSWAEVFTLAGFFCKVVFGDISFKSLNSWLMFVIQQLCENQVMPDDIKPLQDSV